MSSAKLHEALKHVAEAEKALKTSLFKWSSDYDTAVIEYTKAGVLFKAGASLEKSKDCLIKAADIQLRLNSLFQSAKLLAQAGAISRELKRTDESIELMERACNLYRENGTIDTAALTLAKTAKMCEEERPEKAVQFYVQATDLCEMDGKIRDAMHHIDDAARIEVKQNRLLEAGRLMERRLEFIKLADNPGVGHKVTLAMVLVYLTERDLVAANNAYQNGFQFEGFGGSDESHSCEQLIKSIDEGDGEMLKETVNSANVKHQDVHIARLAKALAIPGGVGERKNDVTKPVERITDISETIEPNNDVINENDTVKNSDAVVEKQGENLEKLSTEMEGLTVNENAENNDEEEEENFAEGMLC